MLGFCNEASTGIINSLWGHSLLKGFGSELGVMACFLLTASSYQDAGTSNTLFHQARNQGLRDFVLWVARPIKKERGLSFKLQILEPFFPQGQKSA